MYGYERTADGSVRFFRLARFSFTAEYAKGGRSIHSARQGIIWQAWINGHSFVDDVPSRASSEESYIQYHVANCRLLENVAKSLRMPSRLYFGYKIMNRAGTEPIAVVIVESTLSTRYAKDELLKIFTEKGPYLSHIAESIATKLPRPAEATRLGF